MNRHRLPQVIAAAMAAWLGAAVVAAPPPTPAELVDGYERALAPLSRVTYWQESRYRETLNGEPKLHDGPGYGKADADGRVTVRTHYRRDGYRLDVLSLRDGVKPGPDVWAEPERHLSRTIVDGSATVLHYHHTTARLRDAYASRWTPKDSTAEESFRRQFDGGFAVLDGVLPGRADKSLPQILRDAPDLRVRPQPELVEGHAAFVLECTDAGAAYRYEVCIDPAVGFLPRRVVQTRTDSAADGTDVTVDAVRVEKVGGQFVSVAAHSKAVYRHAETQFLKTHEADLRRSDFDFDPDFKAVRAFKFVVPEKVFVRNQDDPLPGGRWKVIDGEFVLISRDPP